MQKATRTPKRISLTDRGVLSLEMLMKNNNYRYPSEIIEKLLNSEASRLPTAVKERLAEEQRVCPFASRCEELARRLEKLEVTRDAQGNR